MDVPTAGPHMGQIVIQTPDLAARDRVKSLLNDLAAREFTGVDVYVKNLEIGPPVGKPVQYRVSSPDIDKARDAARGLASVIAQEPRLRDITLDWNEPARVIRLSVDQDQARQLGITSHDVANALAAVFTGTTVTQLRDDIYLINVVARGADADRQSIDSIRNLQLTTGNSGNIPLVTLASLEYETEQPLIMQRDGLPTVAVKAAIQGKEQPATLVAALADRVADYVATLPEDVTVELGGTVEFLKRKPSADRGRGSGHAAADGVSGDGPDAKLPTVPDRVRRGAAGTDRRGGGAGPLRCADGFRCHPGDPCPDRNPDPQLGHPGA